MYTHSILYYRHRLSVNKNTPKLHRSIDHFPFLASTYPSYHIRGRYRTPLSTTPTFRLLNLPWQARRHATRGLNLHQLVQSACRHGTIKIQSDDNLATPFVKFHYMLIDLWNDAPIRMDSIFHILWGKYESVRIIRNYSFLSFKRFHENRGSSKEEDSFRE